MKLAILCILLMPMAAQAKLLYVNNGGSPSCSDNTSYAANDAAHPWCSLLRATWGNTNRMGNSTPAQAAQAGDTVYVATGTYQTQSFDSRTPVYNPANSGTSESNRIVFQAVGTVRLITTNAPAAPPWNTGSPIIGADNRDYITWDGFTINQHDIDYTYGNGIVQVWGDYVTIKNCTLIGEYLEPTQGDQHNGILAQGVRNGADLVGLVIQNNRIYGFTGRVEGDPNHINSNATGITLYWLADALIEHNEIYNN